MARQVCDVMSPHSYQGTPCKFSSQNYTVEQGLQPFRELATLRAFAETILGLTTTHLENCSEADRPR